MKPTEKPLAYSYIRFSTPDQMTGDSLRRQTEMAENYANENGLILDDRLTYRDLGTSAWLGVNATAGALGLFLDAVRNHRIKSGSYLLVEAQDRLTRAGPGMAIGLLEEITKAGINIVILAKKRLVNRAILLSNPYIYFEILSDSILAQQESNEKSRRVGAAWVGKRMTAGAKKKPMTAMCPEWLELKKDELTNERVFHARPDRVAIVQRIFELTAAGMGKRAIAKLFNVEGITTWAVWKKAEEGQEWRLGTPRANGWHDSYIQKIVNNVAVLGNYQPHRRDPVTHKRTPEGDPIEGYFPQVVSQELWGRAHTRPSAPRGPRKPKTANLFSGVVIDGYTGAVMRFVDKGSVRDGRTVGDWRYLQSDISRLQSGTKAQTWPYGHFEEFILKHLRNLDWTSVANHQPDDQTAQLRIEEAELADSASKLRANLDKLFETFLADDTSPALMQAAKAKASKLSEKLEHAEAQLRATRATLDKLTTDRSSATEGIDEFKELIATADPQSRVRLQSEIRRRVKSITLFRNGHPNFAHLAPPEPATPKKRSRGGGINSLTPDKWPVVVIRYANGHSQVVVASRIGPAESHATRQKRDPATGAFIKSTGLPI